MAKTKKIISHVLTIVLGIVVLIPIIQYLKSIFTSNDFDSPIIFGGCFSDERFYGWPVTAIRVVKSCMSCCGEAETYPSYSIHYGLLAVDLLYFASVAVLGIRIYTYFKSKAR